MALPTAPPAARSRRRPSRLVVMVAAALVVLAGAELATRAVASRFEPALTFYSQEADTKAARMDELAAAGGADVVFLGTSQVGWGIRPDVVEQQLGVTAYNASLGGATPTIMAPWALDVVLPRLRPGIVVIGVSSLDLQDSRFARERTLQYVESDGARRAAGAESLLERVDRWIGDRSVLWRERGVLRDPSAWGTALRGGHRLPPFVESIDRWGYNRIGQDLSFADRPLTGPGVRRWDVGRENRQALVTLIRGARATGARVVLLDMPVTEQFVRRHPNGLADYRRFQDVLARLAGNHGATVLRYAHGDLRSFGDLIHLNGPGALAFSERLALDLAQVLPDLPGAAVPPSPGSGADVAAPGGVPSADPAPGAATPTAPPSPPEQPALPAAPDDVAPIVVAPAIALPPVPVPDVTVPPVPVDPATGHLPEDPTDPAARLGTPRAGG